MPRLRKYGRTIWTSQINDEDINIKNPFIRKRKIKKTDFLNHIIVCRTTTSALRNFDELWIHYREIKSMFEKYIMSYDSHLCLLVYIPDFYLLPFNLGISDNMALSFLKQILMRIQAEIQIHQKRQLDNVMSPETITEHRLKDWIDEIQTLENETCMV